MRFLLPVLPDTHDSVKTALSDTDLADNIQPWPKSRRPIVIHEPHAATSYATSGSNGDISIKDSFYGYKSMVLKKTTEEGLKDVIKNGVKSKATATVTYKVLTQNA